MKTFILPPLPMVAVLAMVAAGSELSQPRCTDCGCPSFKKVCRLVCTMKEDIDYEYDVDHDDYCLPGVSEIRGKKWVPDCKSLFGCRKVLCWQPRCTCKVRSRKSLVKIRVVKKVPTYNCVVDRVCCQCGKSQVDAQATEEARQQGIRPEAAAAAIDFDSSEPPPSGEIVSSRQALQR